MAIHVVETGESLWGISRKYGVSIQTIIDVNGLESANLIVPGLALYIPDNQLPIRFYQIKAGDTLWAIARRFNTDLPYILSANPRINQYPLFIGQKINIPSPNKLEIATLGFIVPYNPQTFLATYETFADQLTYIAVVAYTFTDEGYAYVLLEDGEIITRSKQLNVIPLLMVRNFRDEDFNAELAGRVLENPIYRRNLIVSLVNLVRQKGYGGVSIDLEFIPPPRRNDFISFLIDLKTVLGDLILHVNVHAKTEDIPSNPIIGAYDYRAIGNIADIVAVMTIDYGYPTGPPDPISPAWWVEQVIRYSITQINPRKLQIAFPLYGYDKAIPSNLTKALSVAEAQNLAIRSEIPIQYDTFAESPWYRYWIAGQEHVVWFEDIRSYIAKYRLIDLYQLLGATYWQLSLPANQNWSYMKNNIIVVKK